MNGAAAAAITGRQGQRSSAAAAAGAGMYPPRQLSSDHFLSDSAAAAAAGSRWAAGMAQPQVDYSRAARGASREIGGGLWSGVEPASPMVPGDRSGVGEVSPNTLSPGLLDLHSYDTELLSEMPVTDSLDNATGFYFSRDQSYDEAPSKYVATSDGNIPKVTSVAKIKVVVRKRPLNKKEIGRKEEDIITINSRTSSLTVHETKLKVDLTEYVEKHEFVFDAVLDEDVSNEEVYRETVEPIVPAIFQRMKATCFAYGQTGSGKTYTMQPLPLKASHDILRLMQNAYRNQGFQLFVSFFEIYGGKLFDLLNEKRKLTMREDGKQQVCIVGLQEFMVSDVDMIKDLIERGNASRSTGTTGANEESSRSHAILQLVIKKIVEGKEKKPARVIGKLSFIDLAGSERGADTYDNDKQTRIEGAEINKSLLALKECIRALDNDQVHIPFRGSKLTEVLRDSFIGNSSTVMISCISPNSNSCEHTLNTLRYADRVKSLSKGGSRKDMSSGSTNIRDSTTGTLSSAPPTMPMNDFNSDVAADFRRFIQYKQMDQEPCLSSNYGHATGGREEVQPPPVYSNHFKEPPRNSAREAREDEDDSPEEACEQEKPPRRKRAENTYADGARKGSQVQWKNAPNTHGNGVDPDDFYLNALLKEEADLVTAHREQVEETINILREEMALLEEADQPDNQLDDYILRLSTILSRKSTGLTNLQARLAQFQRRLAEHNVLVSPLNF